MFKVNLKARWVAYISFPWIKQKTAWASELRTSLGVRVQPHTSYLKKKKKTHTDAGLFYFKLINNQHKLYLKWVVKWDIAMNPLW